MSQDKFTQNGDVKLHYVTAGKDEHLIPLIYMPGFMTDADSFKPEMEILQPRRTVSAGRRGLGKSDAPKQGYSLEHQTADLAQVVTGSGLSTFCLMAFSMGVPVAINYAANNVDSVAGLILLDFGSYYMDIPPQWAEAELEKGTAPEHVIYGYQSESANIDLADKLSDISCPVLLIRGGEGSAVDAEDRETYLQKLPDVWEVLFEDSGHGVYKPDHERFISTIVTFLERLDAKP